jgi:hypothetical protein
LRWLRENKTIKELSTLKKLKKERGGGGGGLPSLAR